MKNPNALIAMAQVAQNANNPYEAFCEYIEYCLFSNASCTMTLSEIKSSIENEFGLYLPHNIILKCLSTIQAAGIIAFDNHQIKRIGQFDITSFDHERERYRSTELQIINGLKQYASRFSREWTEEYTRELLIKVLDRSGLAYDIFLHEGHSQNGTQKTTLFENGIIEMLPDDEEIDSDDIDNQPYYTDDYFVGKFIEEILVGDGIQKNYLREICEGLMICVGTYQLPSDNSSTISPQISGTKFFFDTKILLRFLGCAGEAAVSATKELVELIQKAGGKIYYYPQTLEEMERAFDNAVKSLSNGYSPSDDEMRLYAMCVNNNCAVITAKKATLKSELASANIQLATHEVFTDTERIRFGFDHADLQQFMHDTLPWNPQVVDNDALAIWETHMRRRGNYSEYCGAGEHLPVFVTTNSRLISTILKYRENRPGVPSLYGWKQNRLPVITDVRLTCRLWSPADNSKRLSMLYLTANAVAAKRPTKRYLNSIRTLAIQLSEQVPEYSEICLPAYFDDAVTEAVLETTMGKDSEMNINSFANSIAELAEWKAKDQEEITNKAIAERDGVSDKLKNQTQNIIYGAVNSVKKLIGWRKAALWLIVMWPFTVTIIFVAISTIVSIIIKNWNLMWTILLPMILKGIEICSASSFVGKPLAKWLFPKIDVSIDNCLSKGIRMAEQPYKDTIIQQVKEQTPIWIKCKEIAGK